MGLIDAPGGGCRAGERDADPSVVAPDRLRGASIDRMRLIDAAPAPPAPADVA